MDKDYGITINTSIVCHTDDTIDFGFTIHDSDNFEYDRKFENISSENKDLITVVKHTAKEAIEEYANNSTAKRKEEEEKRKAAEEAASEEFMSKNADLDKLYAMYERAIEKNRSLAEELESYRIDNQILRMRNDKLVNDCACHKKEKKPAEEIKTNHPKSDIKYKCGLSNKNKDADLAKKNEQFWEDFLFWF